LAAAAAVRLPFLGARRLQARTGFVAAAVLARVSHPRMPRPLEEPRSGNQPFREHSPSPQPLSHQGRGALDAGRSCRAFVTKRCASDDVAAARLPSPLAGEGPGERGDARCGIHLPPQAALAALGLGRTSAVSGSRLLPSYACLYARGAGAVGRGRLQRVTTSRCIGASLASSLFWAENGTPLACMASCRISTSALNSSRRMSRPWCDSAMLRPL